MDAKQTRRTGSSAVTALFSMVLVSFMAACGSDPSSLFGSGFRGDSGADTLRGGSTAITYSGGSANAGSAGAETGGVPSNGGRSSGGAGGRIDTGGVPDSGSPSAGGVGGDPADGGQDADVVALADAHAETGAGGTTVGTGGNSSNGGTVASGGAAGAGGTPGTGGTGNGCLPTEKLCNGSCVSQTDPSYGCDPVQCLPACSFTNATAKCVADTCTIAQCARPYQDCDTDPANGCEVNTSKDAGHCGSCASSCAGNQVCASGSCTCTAGQKFCNGACVSQTDPNYGCDPVACLPACSVPNGSATCTNGRCAIGACVSPYADCDLSITDGCETDTNADPNNCGTCGKMCFANHGSSTCSGGACQISGCASNYDDCDGFYQNGCETLLTTLSNCGACSQTCQLPNAFVSCSTQSCKVTACASPYGDCDGVATNGCETNTNTSAKNCGFCGNVCDPGYSCISSSCVPTP